MRFAIIRHADAEQESPTTLGDFGRALTPLGRRQATDLAHWLRDTYPQPFGLLLASPLVRAVQTAEIVASLGNQGTVAASDALRPGSPVGGLLDLERKLPLGGAVVSHEPTVSELAASLLGRAALPFPFEKAACLLLDREGGSYRFAGYRAPFGPFVKTLD